MGRHAANGAALAATNRPAKLPPPPANAVRAARTSAQ
jgi:hypothetical protein